MIDIIRDTLNRLFSRDAAPAVVNTARQPRHPGRDPRLSDMQQRRPLR